MSFPPLLGFSSASLGAQVRRLAVSFSLLAGVFALAPSAQAAEPVSSVRLYALDCGRVHFNDGGIFSDTGEYDGKPLDLAAPCFVIRHPKGTLLWDTGLGDALAKNKDGVDNNGIHLAVPVTLASQLERIGLAPADINVVGFSHFHFDHTGNAALFTGATWLINKAELDFALSEPTPFGVSTEAIAGYKNVKVQNVEGDYDVFGDGSVRLLKAPGHTPGHAVLMLRLAKSGVVILSGDLAHTHANYDQRRVPAFNFNRADSLASLDRVHAIAKRLKARVVIQHDPKDFAALPHFPAYLQ
ncbi:N-acyl homoserine lactonase family protein [Niveibacterium sp. SC-1]|uniref:N-acyl homoserine lactonase family protein n=1 Tax=Niveibacterium sp. SC-1 TaxID=3135646 RepID=UPI00311E7AAD